MTPDDLPVVEPPFDADGASGGYRPTASARSDRDECRRRVAGVLLAAGTSSRYGGANKLVADVDGEPMVRRAARALLAADLEPVVVVVGHEAIRIREAVAPLEAESEAALEFVENPDFRAGQATSVEAGVAALPNDVDAAVFALGDMPWIDGATVRLLVRAYCADAGTALAAAVDGERGNPVLWDARHFDALADQSGDVGGRDLLLATEGAALVETGDQGVRQDVDRPEDLD